MNYTLVDRSSQHSSLFPLQFMPFFFFSPQKSLFSKFNRKFPTKMFTNHHPASTSDRLPHHHGGRPPNRQSTESGSSSSLVHPSTAAPSTCRLPIGYLPERCPGFAHAKSYSPLSSTIEPPSRTKYPLSLLSLSLSSFLFLLLVLLSSFVGERGEGSCCCLLCLVSKYQAIFWSILHLICFLYCR